MITGNSQKAKPYIAGSVQPLPLPCIWHTANGVSCWQAAKLQMIAKLSLPIILMNY